MVDLKALRADFPLISSQAKQSGLAYLDNAATTQKPKSVLDAIQHFYLSQNANIHRGVYPLAEEASRMYDQCREKIAQFINAKQPGEVIYTSGSTAGINLVCQSYLAPRLKQGDEVLISAMEHHANLIPWQQLCIQKGAILRVITIDEKGDLDLDHFQQLLSNKTRFLALCHISNTLGTINPVQDIISQAHGQGIPVLIDAAQSMAHYAIDVQSLDCDFLVCSGHKMYGPTGTGFLYARSPLLKQMQPVVFGGGSIRSVSFEQTEWAGYPSAFEPGTPNIAGIAGLGAAIDYLMAIPSDWMQKHLHDLKQFALDQLTRFQGLRIIGQAQKQSGIISFIMEQAHPHDIASILASEGVAIRAGHHCTQPLLDHWALGATARVSFGIYNKRAEVDQLVHALQEVVQIFS